MPIKTVQVDNREELKKLFNIFKIEEKTQSNKLSQEKVLTQEEVDFGRKLVEEMAELQKENANKLLDLLKPRTLNENEAKEGRKLVEKLAELPYEFPRATVAVDVVVFGILPGKDELHVFVHKPPQEHKDYWWLPGRFMHSGKSFLDEIASDDNWTLERTMRDALTRKWKVGNKSETIVDGIKVISEESPEVEISYTIKPNIDLICQLEPMSALDRDDRHWRVLSIPYMTLICVKDGIPSAIPEKTAQWMPVSKLIKIKKDGFEKGDEKLAHDHFDILKNGLIKLFQEVRTRPIGGSKDMVGEDVKKKYLSEEERDGGNLDDYVMLPSEFDVYHLIDIYSVVMRTIGVFAERSNLKKLLLDRSVIEEIGNRNQSGKGGSAYKFTDKYKVYRQNMNFGFNPKVKDEG